MAYTSKIKSPVYKPTGKNPTLDELVDGDKYTKLSQKISVADIDQEVKFFLRKAATRHYKFDYGKIADYYANAPKEVQELFEQSGLVIVDFDSAIENGFVMMNKKLMEIRSETE